MKKGNAHRKGAWWPCGNAAGRVWDAVGARQRPKLREGDRQVNADVGGDASLAQDDIIFKFNHA